MKKTKIDWAEASWNPVTGCFHGCEYCYARSMATHFAGFMPDKNPDRFRHGGTLVELDGRQERMRKDGKIVPAAYPYGFTPTLHRYRLGEPARWTKPRNIFVCSMADLFGDWVPDEWIQEVFKACEAAPQHRYLFLTKNPNRYNDLIGDDILPNRTNFWYGCTQTGKDSEREHESPDVFNTFLSVEPLLAPMERETLYALEMWGWVIVGAETGNRKNKVIPKREWVEEIAQTCEDCGIPIFMKGSLRDLMGNDFRQEYPWEVAP